MFIYKNSQYKIQYEINFESRNSSDGDIITYITVRDPSDESKRVGNIVGSATFREEVYDIDMTRQLLIRDCVPYIVSSFNLNEKDTFVANELIINEMLDEYMNLPDSVRLLG